MPKKFEIIINNDEMVITEENLKYTLEQFYGSNIKVREVAYNPTAEERNKTVVKEIFDLVNIMGNWNPLAFTFSRHLITEHRTLIQSFFRTIQKVISTYAENGSCDARNKGSLDWALDVAKIKAYMPEI